MAYYFSTTLENTSFDEAIVRTTEALKDEGFGVLTEIDISATLKQKLGVDLNKYTILGACNPSFAYKALQLENKIGTMLPCNIIVQELSPNTIEISAVDPEASMQAVGNKALGAIAGEVKTKIKNVIANV